MGNFNTGLWNSFAFGFQPVQLSDPGALFGYDLAYVAYRIAGILPEAGRGYSISEGNDALRILNSMIRSMQAERLMVWAYVRSVFDIVPGQQAYTVGNIPVNNKLPDWHTIPRPEELTLAGYVFTNTSPAIENPMRILNYQEWAALSPKDLQSSIEYILYFQPDVPNATCFLWPVPADPSVKVALYTWTNVQRVNALTDAMILPPAYQEMFEYGMAIRLAGMYWKRAHLDPMAVAQYDAARLKVMSANINTLKLQMQAEFSSGGFRESRGRWMIWSNTTQGGYGSGGF